MANVTAATTIATIPTAFSYQGTLRLADGSLATGSYNITLKIYNGVTGGSALYSESFSNVVVRNGNFSVVVGDAQVIAPAIFDNANLYIGITVAPDPEMLPRQRLFPVPWAMQASQANTANSATTATTATTLASNATIDGLIINKGVTNDGALKLTSSGPGWGSGIRFRIPLPTTPMAFTSLLMGPGTLWTRRLTQTVFITMPRKTQCFSFGR